MSGFIAFVVVLLEIVVQVSVAVRVIMRRLPVGVSLAWVSVVLFLPVLGPIAYLLFGELRLGNRRAIRLEHIHHRYVEWLSGLQTYYQVSWNNSTHHSLARLAEKVAHIPALPGNTLELISDTDSFFENLIREIDSACHSCLMAFYIWSPGGRADKVAEALMRAAGRGVDCRVLLDDVGSSVFLKGPLVETLRSAGVRVVSALPVGLFRALFWRLDLRLHRKIVVIDAEIGYTGSCNLVDPEFFKQEANVGEWVDAMVRLRGPAVEGLIATFIEDWELETGHFLENHESIRARRRELRAENTPATGIVQVIPSGPLIEGSEILGVLLMALYSAKKEVILTTPYFVPDEAILMALTSAAQRGVEVTLILPERVDSSLVRLASQAFKGDLLETGVRVMLFSGGLLHTKSVTVDGEFCLFGSVNLDPRSIFLNFEVTLGIYDSTCTQTIRKLQCSYLENSYPMDLKAWQERSWGTKLSENSARLLGPLL